MPRSGEGPTESGILVYPKLPVPMKGRESEPRMHKNKGGMRKRLIIGGIVLVAGMVLGIIVRPMVMTDPRVSELEDQIAVAAKAGDDAKTRADEIAKQLEKTTTAKQAADKALIDAKRAQAQIANQEQEAAARTKALEAIRDKLKAVDKSLAPAIDGDEVRLTLATGVLFKVNDDELTPRGKQVLDRLAAPLKEMSDRQIWIIGHTDDTPPPQPKAPRLAPQPLPKKGQKAPTVVLIPPASRFPTNWELASLRAIAIVHHFQNTSKLDPTRLAAQTFGQYRPASRTNKALNRRIEIVVAPKLAATR